MIAAKKIELIVRKALNLVPRTSEGVVSYDVDNLYPQRIANLVDASKTATACCDKAKETSFARDSLTKSLQREPTSTDRT